MDLTMEEVMDGLEPLLADLDEIPRSAMRMYQDQYPAAVRIEHTKSSAANCIYSHMLSEAHRRLSSDRPGLIFKNVRGLNVWLWRDVAVLRFKRMDESGRFRRYPTKQARAYDRNQPLPGLAPPAVRLAVGYLPDPTGTDVVRVQIARPMARSIEWCAAIVPREQHVAGERAWIDVTPQRRFA